MADAVAGAEAIVNFAAETHVDRSIAEPVAFSVTNGQGTHVLLEAARERGAALRAGLHRRGLRLDRVGLVHRELAAGTRRAPTARPRPAPTCWSAATSTPTGCETLVCRGSNNYGPRQYPEKLIPLMILNALAGDHLPVYGDGRNVRNWLFVEDFGRGIGHVLAHGQPGEVYNCGGPDECENLEVVKRILELTGADESLIEYVTDRPGHDRRYSLSSREARGRWAGSAQTRFEEGLGTHRRLVPRQRLVVGADPHRRLPRVLRAPLRPSAQGLSDDGGEGATRAAT